MKFIFSTTATMKEYNCKKWWIDQNIIPTIRISADNLKDALLKYREIAEEKGCVEISANAMKRKNPMFVTTKDGEDKQVGYVITAKAEFQDSFYRWSEQYIDLWVNIETVTETVF